MTTATMSAAAVEAAAIPTAVAAPESAEAEADRHPRSVIERIVRIPERIVVAPVRIRLHVHPLLHHAIAIVVTVVTAAVATVVRAVHQGVDDRLRHMRVVEGDDRVGV